MKLKVYLAENDLTMTDFCKSIGYCNSYLSILVSGKRLAGKKVARDVEIATQGLVKLKTKETLRQEQEKKEISESLAS